LRRRILAGAPTAREVCFGFAFDDVMIYCLGLRVQDIAGLESIHRCGLRVFRAFAFKSGTHNRRTRKGDPCWNGVEHGDHMAKQLKSVLDLGTTASQRYEAVPRRARIQGSQTFVSQISRPKAIKKKKKQLKSGFRGVSVRRTLRYQIPRGLEIFHGESMDRDKVLRFMEKRNVLSKFTGTGSFLSLSKVANSWYT